jgi:regulatory protein
MEQEKRGLPVALEILSRRDRSEAELRRRLLAREFPDEEIDAVVARLKELRYLDDRRLAERLAAAAVAGGRGYGIRLVLDLAKRGIPRDIIDETLTGLTAEHDERNLVRNLLARKFPAFDPTAANSREKARVMNFLLRRGFSRSAVFEAMKHPSTDFAEYSLNVNSEE